MNANELRKSSQEELGQKIVSLKEDLFGLRMKNASGQLGDKTKIRRIKRAIAKTLTVLHECEEKGESL